MARKADRTERLVWQFHEGWRRERPGVACGVADTGALAELAVRVEQLQAMGGVFAQVRLSPHVVSNDAVLASCVEGGVATEG